MSSKPEDATGKATFKAKGTAIERIERQTECNR